MAGNPFHKPVYTVVLLLLVALVILGCALPEIAIPSSPSLPPSTDHILVSLTDPRDGESYPVSAALSVRGEAISDGSITRLELWEDGKLYETYAAPEDGLGLLAHSWTWSAKSLGTHTLLVRAYNNLEQSAFSNVIRLTAIPDPGHVLITKAGDTETLTSLAERYDVPASDILRDNPALAGSTLIPPGTEIFLHVDAQAVVSAPSAAARALMKLNEWSVNRSIGGFGLPESLSAPILAASGQGCNAALAITDTSSGEKGFNIYRLKPGAVSFTKVTTLPAHTGSGAIPYQDPDVYGLYHYYVASFDNAGESASNLVGLNVTSASCAGKPATLDSLASIPAGVEDYYLYIAINQGKWRRFPADEFTYLKRSDNLDFNQILSSLAPNLAGSISVRGEVWGMMDGTATLLGKFDKSFKAGQPPAVLSPVSPAVFLTTKLEVRGVFNPSTGGYPWFIEKGTAFTQEVFRFGTDTAAEYGIWQVSSAPPGPDSSFEPACLLLTGKAYGSGTHVSPFEFGIDLSALKPKIESVKLSPFGNSLEMTPAFSPYFSPQKLDTSPQQVVSEPKFGAGAIGIGGAPLVAGLDPCTKNVSADGIISFYVRIIPMSSGQAAGKPSNTVKMIYDPNGEIKITIPYVPIPIEPYYDVQILSFTGVHVPELYYSYCVEVIKNDHILLSYVPGDVICPETFTGGNDDDLLGAVETAFNFISKIYNKLSDWATELVDKLNPLCIQAKMVSSAINVGGKEVKDACHYIAVIAVTAAKTYVGLPPSLPNFDQLTELGKENLVELAAQELEDNGVPCPEACKDVIRKGINASIDQVKAGMNNSSCVGEVEAHEKGFEPLCLPAGVLTKPDPRGQPAPAVVQVQITRRPNSSGPNFPEPKACQVSIHAYAKNNTIGTYHTEAGFKWSGGAIEGDLFNSSEAFANLQPGTSTKIPIILDPVPYWLPGHKQFVQGGWKPEHVDDWGILYKGAMTEIKAGGICQFVLPEGTGFTDKSISGDSKQYGPLGDAWNQFCHPYNCP